MHACKECGVPASDAHRQKQVDNALLRARQGNPPRGKCRAFIVGDTLAFYHYHHLLLVYDTGTRAVQFRWHERPTDLRVLLAVQAALDDASKTVVEPNAAQAASGSCAGTSRVHETGEPDDEE